MLSLLRWAVPARPEPPFSPPQVRIGLVGRQHSGKSVTLDMLPDALDRPFPSGLRLDFSDPRLLARVLRQGRAIRHDLHCRGRTTTVAPNSLKLSLLDGEREVADVRVRDAVGQMLTNTTPEAPPESQRNYERYLDSLARDDVLIAFVPCPPIGNATAGEQRLREDVRLVMAYLREALNRRAGRPCSLAVCVSRIDCRYRSEADAQARMPREFLRWLAVQFAPLAGAAEVADACVFPMSGLGFGRTVERPRAANWDELTLGEPEWLLARGGPRPFNLAPLLAWSVLSALEHRQQAEFSTSQVREATTICRRLRADLEALGGWRRPLKAG